MSSLLNRVFYCEKAKNIMPRKIILATKLKMKCVRVTRVTLTHDAWTEAGRARRGRSPGCAAGSLPAVTWEVGRPPRVLATHSDAEKKLDPEWGGHTGGAFVKAPETGHFRRGCFVSKVSSIQLLFFFLKRRCKAYFSFQKNHPQF